MEILFTSSAYSAHSLMGCSCSLIIDDTLPFTSLRYQLLLCFLFSAAFESKLTFWRKSKVEHQLNSIRKMPCKTYKLYGQQKTVSHRFLISHRFKLMNDFFSFFFFHKNVKQTSAMLNESVWWIWTMNICCLAVELFTCFTPYHNNMMFFHRKLRISLALALTFDDDIENVHVYVRPHLCGSITLSMCRMVDKQCEH